jgi:hypothetical protein
MNQHPRAKEMGITPGPWTKQKDYSSVYSPNGLLIEGNYNGHDLQLCADAGNVMNQTGRTPSELAEIVRELREYVEKHDQWNHVARPRIRKELLEKTGGFT